MKYNKNLANKLKNMGFEFNYKEDNPIEGTNYEVWLKGKLDITIDHARQKVCLNIENACCDTEEFTQYELMVLDKLFNQNTPEKHVSYSVVINK